MSFPPSFVFSSLVLFSFVFSNMVFLSLFSLFLIPKYFLCWLV